MAYVIRKFHPADIDGIVDVENECFPPGDSFSYEQLKYLATKSKGLFLVCQIDNQIVGYTSMLARENGHGLRIYSIAVCQKARGNGIARAFLDKGKEYTKKHHLNKLTLEVRTDNASAISLYEFYGFKKLYIIPQYYHDGCDAYKMAIQLQH